MKIVSDAVSLDDFDFLYRTFGPMVLRRCRFLLKDEEKALDALQDVFVRILERKQKLETVCSSLFYVTATHICLNKIRADKIRAGPAFDSVEELVCGAAAASHEEKIDAGIFLDYIFSRRDEKDREIAFLHYLDGFTLEETAERMEMSVSGVRKRLSALRKYAEEQEG